MKPWKKQISDHDRRPGEKEAQADSGMSYSFMIEMAERNADTPSLDVHGDARDIAAHYAGEFIERQYDPDKNKVVKIIFGLGEGILANEVPPFVKNHPMVVESRVSTKGFEAGAVVYAVLKNADQYEAGK